MDTEHVYSLDNTWGQARRRLDMLEAVCDPDTFRRLDGLGVRPGWRCLDLGAGGGSVARRLCDLVGASGSVVAVDLEPRFLLADPRPNMEILAHDLVADGIPGEGYDLIHARCLLQHLPGRDGLLAEMVKRLRPGGTILLEEADMYPTSTAERPAFVELWNRICAAVQTIGADWHWPRRLPALLSAAGVRGVRAEATIRYFTAGDPMAELHRLSIEQLAPLLLVEGTPQELIDEVLAALVEPTNWFPSYALIGASGTVD